MGIVLTPGSTRSTFITSRPRAVKASICLLLIRPVVSALSTLMTSPCCVTVTDSTVTPRANFRLPKANRWLAVRMIPTSRNSLKPCVSIVRV